MRKNKNGMECVYVLRVAKEIDGEMHGGYFGGYWYDNQILCKRDPLNAMFFEDGVNDIESAKKYLEKNGWYYDVQMLEFKLTKVVDANV